LENRTERGFPQRPHALFVNPLYTRNSGHSPRNLFNKDYLDLLSAQPGNTGLYVAQPGDPRTFGVTLRLTFKSR